MSHKVLLSFGNGSTHSLEHPVATRILVCLLLLVGTTTLAYQPGMEELRNKVTELELRLEKLEADSSSKAEGVISTKDSIIALKDQMVQVQRSEIASVRRQQSMREDNRATLGLIAFGLLLVTALAVTFLGLFARRLELQKGQGVFQVLANDLQAELSPDQESDKRKFRVHFIVWMSVIIMFVSMCMYLFRVM